MTATDYESALISRLWAILEAHTPFTDVVKVANRIKLLDAPPKLGIKHDPTSFPKVVIDIPTTSDTLYTLGESYAMRAGATFNTATQGVAEDLNFNVVIDIQHDKTFSTARQLVAEILTALRKAGPNLGITAFRLQRIGPAQVQHARSSDGDDRGIAGPRPLATRINLPALLRVKTSDLLV